MVSRLSSACCLLFATAGLTAAQTGPQLLTVFPPGAKAGQTVEITCTGVGFDGEEKLLASGPGFTAERIAPTPKDPKAPKGGVAATVKFKLTVPKEPGYFDLRLVNKSGLSNPRAFVVGGLTEVNETEPNNDVGQAQAVELNTTVNGVIATPTDVDYVVFRAKAGQGVVVACRTSSLDSRLAADLMVATADGRRLGESRGYQDGEAVVDFVAPTDGEYLVRVCQFAYTSGGSDHFYRLTVSSGPWVDAVFPPVLVPGDRPTARGEGRNFPPAWKPQPASFVRPDGRPFDAALLPLVVDPNAVMIAPPAAAADLVSVRTPASDSPALLLAAENPLVVDEGGNDTPETARPLTPPCDVAGRIARKHDRHWYSFAANKGDVWVLELFADRLGSRGDAYLRVTDAAGKTLAEADDPGESLSPNQFYTRSDDPARVRFVAPADGTYRVLVSTRDAGIVFGPRERFVLRIAREKPDFRLAVMPVSPHLLDAATLARDGAVLLNVYVFRHDGFNGPISLTATGLPPGVSCPPQVLPPGQSRGVVVLTAGPDAPDWEGFVTVVGTAGPLKREARPFSLTWPIAGAQANQPPPNVPAQTRSDRGGLALAVRGTAPVRLIPSPTTLTAKAGEKLELTVQVRRGDTFKDPVAIYSAVPLFGTPGKGGNPPPPLATIPPDKTEAKLSVEVAANAPAGTYSLVLRGQSAVPPPKDGTPPARLLPTYPAPPVLVTVEAPPPKKK